MMGESPNGLRLSGARKGVRCSRGLGVTNYLSPSRDMLHDLRLGLPPSG
jgi:hypothetical protein